MQRTLPPISLIYNFANFGYCDTNPMSSVKKLAKEIESGLLEALPRLRKTIVRKLPLAVAAMLDAQTANTAELANRLPLDLERADMREQWLRRLLSNGLLNSAEVMEPFARQVLIEAARHDQVVLLSLDQTDIDDRFAILMVSVGVGDRALPLCWRVEAGAANIGFAGQEAVLERVRAWLPPGARVQLAADRFYPSAALFRWLQAHDWCYRLRLKKNLLADLGVGDVTTTGALADSHRERYERDVMLFESGVMTHVGIVHDAGHDEPWIIAMDSAPTRAKVLDYAARWPIEPMFSDFKSRGFGLEETHLQDPDRLDRLVLIMALAMHWCVAAGRHDALTNPTPAEKKPGHRPTPATGASVKPIAPCCLGSNAGYGCC
jgi:hypothetical protein